MHTVCPDFVRIMPYFRSFQAYETYEIAKYGNIRQSWGKVAPPHVQASSRRATGVHSHDVTAISRHHDALWTSKAYNGYIDIGDDDTRDPRVVTQRNSQPTHVLATIHQISYSYCALQCAGLWQ